MLTSLSLKFCFMPFEILLPITNALRLTKNLVKLDLSNNGLKRGPAKFVLNALEVNTSLVDISFHGNFLDDGFAEDLSYVLQQNPILYKVDISQNPIGPEGAKKILNVLLEYNETLGSLGDLTQNVLMGVRVRKDLDEALRLNNTTGQVKKRLLNQAAKGMQKQFAESSTIEKGIA